MVRTSPTARVSTEVTFWHSAEYGSDFRLNSGEIPRNSAEFRGISPEFSRNHFRSQKIPRNSVLAEFRGHPTHACVPLKVPSKLLISSYFWAKTFFFTKLSLGYPMIFSGIEVCTAMA
jgi:hypothetical protein